MSLPTTPPAVSGEAGRTYRPRNELSLPGTPQDFNHVPPLIEPELDRP